jgi:ATP-dependent Clp protease ATP-binding subunit ClpX
MAHQQNAAEHPLLCSWCSRSQNEVLKLVAGPGVAKCGECVVTCAAVIGQGKLDETIASIKAEAARIAEAFTVATPDQED